MQTNQSGKRPPKEFLSIGPFVETFSHSRPVVSFTDSEFTSGDESDQKRFSISKSACFKFSIAFSALSSFAIVILIFLLLNKQPHETKFISAMRFVGPYDGNEIKLLKECNEALKDLKCTSVDKNGDDDFIIRFEDPESKPQDKSSTSDADSLYKKLITIQEEGLKLPTQTLYPKQKHDNMNLKISVDKLKVKVEKCKRSAHVKSLEDAERNKNLETQVKQAEDEINKMLEDAESFQRREQELQDIFEQTSTGFAFEEKGYQDEIEYLSKMVWELEGKLRQITEENIRLLRVVSPEDKERYREERVNTWDTISPDPIRHFKHPAFLEKSSSPPIMEFDIDLYQENRSMTMNSTPNICRSHLIFLANRCQ